ncbi:MAG TPA: hypothetical protein VIN40_06855 [Candidatus Tyrphobacter sp.]
MNSVVVTCCVLAALAMLPAQAVRGVLATAAASLFEGTPFILAGMLLRALLSRAPGGSARRWSGLVPLLGCGCEGGPSARSLPAALAAAFTFGPLPALLRLAAALIAERILSSRAQGGRPGAAGACEHGEPLVTQFAALLPAGVLAGVVLHLFGGIDLARVPPPVQLLAGIALGFAAAPCALGAVSLAAALHARAAFAATGMLCICGIADLRALLRGHGARVGHDALAYAVAAVALAAVAARGGDALVNPCFTLPLACSAFACAVLAVSHRRAQCARARVAPALMLAGALLGAPVPTYSATETTMTDLFPGERMTFTGTLVHGAGADALVRFAITCCRADAAPVVVRLVRAPPLRSGTWLRADGTIVRAGAELRLQARRIERVAPPGDPFIYR